MSNSKHLMILTFITLVLAIVAMLFMNQQQLKTGQAATEKLFPNLQEKVNEVAQIEISDAKAKTTLSLKQGLWRVEELENYYADSGKIRSLLLELIELEKLEAKTRIAKNYAKLGLDDPQNSTTARQIVVKDAAENKLAAVILGKNRAPGLYVRQLEDPQSWLTKGFVTANSDATSWLDKALPQMASAQVAKIEVKPVEGKAFTLSRSSAADKLALEQLPEGFELKNIDALQSALQALSFDKVVKADSIDSAGRPRSQIIFSGFDGRAITIENFKVDDNRYTALSLTGAEHGADSAQRLSGWLFQLPGYKLDQLNKGLEDIIRRQAEQSSKPG